TSANISGQPTATNFDEISEEIKNGVDYIVKFDQQNPAKGKPSIIMKLDPSGKFDFIRKKKSNNMKKILSLCAILIAMVTVTLAQENIKPAKVGVQYGKAIDGKKAISVEKLQNTLISKKEYKGK